MDFIKVKGGDTGLLSRKQYLIDDQTNAHKYTKYDKYTEKYVEIYSNQYYQKLSTFTE